MEVASPRLVRQDVTIANGASISSAIDLGNMKLVAIIMPSAWTAAALTFQASESETGTYNDMYDGSTERNYTVSTSRHLMLQISDWIGVRYLKIRSGTSGTPVAQGAARTITILLQP